MGANLVNSPTLGDLAKRLYDKFADTQALLAPNTATVIMNTWEYLSEWQQEVWVTVAAEAVKVGVEIQQEIERQDRGDDRVTHQLPEEDGLFVDIPTVEEDEAPRLKQIADQPRRFVRMVHRDCE